MPHSLLTLTLRQGIGCSGKEVIATSGTTVTVGDIARVAKISVRTLHHYDEIGLLRPADRSEAGYRVYGPDDLERLQVILFFRELGLALSDIARIMSEPSFGRREALLAQRELLAEKARRTEAMLGAIDAALAALEKGTTMDGGTMFEVFGDFDPTQLEGEVRDRWGDSAAFRESSRRTAGYSKDEWLEIRAEGDEIEQAFTERLAAGASPGDAEVMDLAERHRRQIDRWFYPCSHAMHVGLGEMYVADPRFAARYEALRPGLARFVADAIRANAERATSGRRT